MKRRLITLLAILSLLPCVATVALWARSYWISDALGWGTARPMQGMYQFRKVASTSGVLWFAKEDTGFPVFTATFLQGWESHEVTGRHQWETEYLDIYRVGFGYARKPGVQFVICVPHWFVAAVLLTPSVAAWGVARRRRRHFRQGRCPTCGYDLRATPERCPECGTAPNGEPRAAISN